MYRGMLTRSEVAGLLRITPKALSRRVRAGAWPAADYRPGERGELWRASVVFDRLGWDRGEREAYQRAAAG